MTSSTHGLELAFLQGMCEQLSSAFFFLFKNILNRNNNSRVLPKILPISKI